MPKIKYQGKEISIYRLGQISGVPLTTLYRFYRSGVKDGETMVRKARERLIEYEGEYISKHQLCVKTHSDYRSVMRRLKAGVPTEKAIEDIVDRRGCNKTAKLAPSEVLNIYAVLFAKEKTQTCIAKEHGVHPSTISDLWRGKKWNWLTSPLRYKLENQEER